MTILTRETTFFLILLSLTTFSQCLQAGVYRVVDEEGNVTYTDNPPANDPSVETLDLPPVNTQPALQIPVTRKKNDEDETSGYERITIASPAQETTIPPGQLDIPVKVSLEPALKAGDRIQLLFDGQPYGAPGASSLFKINALVRGEHRIQAQVIDHNNNVVISSGITTVYVKRHSIQHHSK